MQPARAANFVVTNVSDDNGACTVAKCSLREAIKQANTLASDDTISISPSLGMNPWIHLTKGELIVEAKGALSIAADSFLTIDAQNLSRVLHLNFGAKATLSNLYLIQGKTNDSSQGGAGILVQNGDLTLKDCSVEFNNSAGVGGGIYSDRGTLTLDKTHIESNSAGSSGGGIALQSCAASIQRSNLSSNTAPSYGGGISIDNGSLNLMDCTVRGNTIDSSVTPHEGSAIYVYNAAVTLDSCSVVSNYPQPLIQEVQGGIYGATGTITVKNSIVASNSQYQDFHMAGATLVNGGFNLIGSNANVSDVFPAGPLTGTPTAPVDPKYSRLSGAYTLFLRRDSPALDQGNSKLATAQNTDQRIFDSPNIPNAVGGNGSDIGAFEATDVWQTGSSLVVNATEGFDGVCGVPHCSLDEAISGANDLQTQDFNTPFNVKFDEQGIFRQLATAFTMGIAIQVKMNIVGPAAGVNISSKKGATCLRLYFGTIGLTRLNFINNKLSSDRGAALLNLTTANITDCTFSGNSAPTGGAVFNLSKLSMSNCTFSGNSAEQGAAITNSDQGTLNLDSCTFAANKASTSGGGILNEGGAVTLTNTLLAGNQAPTGPDISGSYTGTYNLLQNDSGAAYSGDVAFAAAHNQANIDPLIGSLGYYGGTTQTISLRKGSPAIDKGSTDLTVDERGIARPVGTADDIGAFEAKPSNTPVLSKLLLTPAVPYTDDPITAQVTATDDGSVAPQVTYVWKRTRDGVTVTLDEKGPTLQTAGSIVVVGDVIVVSVVASDEYSSSAPQSANVTIANSPIAITDFTLKPRAPYTFEVMMATVKTSDVDRTKPLFNFVWTKNGVVTRSVIGGKSSQDLYNLKADGAGDKGDVIKVEVTATDGASTAKASGSATILNSIPVISLLTLSPEAPTATGTVAATYGGRDADGDALQRTYLWRVGTKILKNETGARVDLSKYSFIKAGDVISVDLQLSDGEAESKTLTAKVTVGATATANSSSASS